jgi:hypothetical protein
MILLSIELDEQAIFGKMELDEVLLLKQVILALEILQPFGFHRMAMSVSELLLPPTSSMSHEISIVLQPSELQESHSPQIVDSRAM